MITNQEIDDVHLQTIDLERQEGINRIINIMEAKKFLEDQFQRGNISVSAMDNRDCFDLAHPHWTLVNIYSYISKHRDIPTTVSMEHCEGTLKSFIENNDLDEKKLLHISLQIAFGLKHLEYHHTAHLNLSTKSVFYKKSRHGSDDNQFLIGVFRTYVEYDENGYSDIRKIKVFETKSMLNRSPEVIRPVTNPFNIMYVRQNDMWDFGCLLYEIITKQQLFQDKKSIIEGQVPQIKGNKPLENLLNRMLCSDLDQRLTTTQLINCLFILLWGKHLLSQYVDDRVIKDFLSNITNEAVAQYNETKDNPKDIPLELLLKLQVLNSIYLNKYYTKAEISTDNIIEAINILNNHSQHTI